MLRQRAGLRLRKFHPENVRVLVELRVREVTGGVSGAAMGAGDQVLKVKIRRGLGGSLRGSSRRAELGERRLPHPVEVCPLTPQGATDGFRAQRKKPR